MRTLMMTVLILVSAPFAAAEQGVKAIQAYVANTTPGMANAAAYVSILNEEEVTVFLSGVSLTGQSEGVAKAAQIHTRIMDGDVMRMIEIPEPLEIAPGETQTMAPGGFHIMLLGLTQPLEKGSVLEVTLHLTGVVADLIVEVPVLTSQEISAFGETYEMVSHDGMMNDTH